MPSTTLIDFDGVITVSLDWNVTASGIEVSLPASVKYIGDFNIASATLGPNGWQILPNWEQHIDGIGTVGIGVAVAVNPSTVSLDCSGWYEFPGLGHHDFGPVSVPYATAPLPPLESGAVQFAPPTAALVQYIKSQPVESVSTPGSGWIDNSPEATAAAETMLWLLNGSYYPSAVQGAAPAAAAGDQSHIGSHPVEFSNMVYAIGPYVGGGAVLGLSGSAGIYMTGGGEIGVFGGITEALGWIFGIEAGITGYCFWEGLESFAGAWLAVNVSAGEIVEAGLGLYWPYDKKVESAIPAGWSWSAGVGVGLPVQGAVGGSYTWVQNLVKLW